MLFYIIDQRSFPIFSNWYAEHELRCDLFTLKMTKTLAPGPVHIVKFIPPTWVNKNIKVKNMRKCQRLMSGL